MQDATSIEVPVGNKTLTLETGALARQAAASVVASIGETFLFCAVSTSKAREGIDFFPMQVEYKEKFYAAGRFPGGFFKREARPSEKEVLIMRVTDRPIRPLFPEGYRNELQINMMLMSTDGTQEVDAMAINAASTALTLSEVPFQGPIGAVRVGRVNGELILEPTQAQMLESDLDLTYAGTRDKLLMMEGESKEIPDDDMVAALKFAHEAIVAIIDAQLEFRKMLGLPDKVIEPVPVNEELMSAAKEFKAAELAEVLTIAGKLERQEKVAELRDALKEQMTEKFPEMTDEEYFHLFDALEIEVVRDNVLLHGKRIDGRQPEEMRPLSGAVGLLPRTHGSAVFQRGETQAVAIVTLGTGGDAQMMDGVTGGPREKNFLLHYNFPPYSVGEAGRLGMTSRREIGHGNLAERSLKNIIPADFPYSVRVVSEVMSSNGSTSMASTCAGTLALMDAGVPITAPVAGISIGLFSSPEKNVLIMDILGSEDHCGDMDFKVCGTRKGVTGFQVDLKIHGLSWDLVKAAFALARQGRLQILDAMESVLPAPRTEMSPIAPRYEKIKIDPEKIGALIGPGGKNIRRITDTFKVQIDIEEDGTVSIFSPDGDALKAAVHEIEASTGEAEIGKMYTGRVTGTKEFGAFVEILPGLEGLVHISQLADYRVNRTEDIVNVGDIITVKCLDVSDNGRVSLSLKAAQAEAAAAEVPAE
ncbi:MAG: polyribonucleotide nucleotidyltransferase [Verrucomicrobia bacterium]|nr:polyribonucleotide nucleotidyltransferase [Verrucomicrobiota bacterium]